MANKNYFLDDNPENKKWCEFIDFKYYDYVITGVNLSKGYYRVDDIMRYWVDSETHLDKNSVIVTVLLGSEKSDITEPLSIKEKREAEFRKSSNLNISTNCRQ